MKWIDFAHFSQAATPYVAIAISFAAIAVPTRRERRREAADARERQLEARCLATALRFAVHGISTTLSGLKLRAATAAVDKTYQHAAPIDLLLAKVTAPSILSTSVDRVYILGDPAGPLVLRLGAVLEVYNEAVETRANICAVNPTTSAAEH